MDVSETTCESIADYYKSVTSLAVKSSPQVNIQHSLTVSLASPYRSPSPPSPTSHPSSPISLEPWKPCVGIFETIGNARLSATLLRGFERLLFLLVVPAVASHHFQRLSNEMPGIFSQDRSTERKKMSEEESFDSSKCDLALNIKSLSISTSNPTPTPTPTSSSMPDTVSPSLIQFLQEDFCTMTWEIFLYTGSTSSCLS